MYTTMTRITEGKGKMGDLEELELISDTLTNISNCGLGETAGTPVRDMLKHFRAEVEAHIKLGICPTGICPMVAEVLEFV